MSIFLETKALTKAVEAHLVMEQESELPFFNYIKRAVWLPPKFLMMGIKEKSKAASTWAFLSSSALIILFWTLGGSIIEMAEALNFLMLLTFLVPAILVTFALPSMYGDHGVSQKDVLFVVEQLKVRGFSSEKEIELLKKSVKLVEIRARSRINSLKWLTGLLWAVFIYVFSKGVDASISTLSDHMSYIYMSAGLFLGVFVGYFLVWGYQAAVDKLFRAIDFGCNDFCLLAERARGDMHDRRTSQEKSA